jgi:two-component system sensor histidine kinase UhpB
VLQRFWYDRTIRTQLLIAIGIINLCALLIAAMVSILNARHATRVEMDASLEIAKRFVRVTIQSLSPDGGNLAKKINQVSSHLQLAHLRHVRIFIGDAAGNLVKVSPQENSGASDEGGAPRWFAALVEPDVSAHRLSVVLAEAGGTVLIVEQPLESVPRVWDLGTVVIAGEPADEIAEVWQDVSSLALVWLLLDALVLAVLYLVLGRMLDPLASLARGLLRLEDGDYATRFTPPRIKELAIIGERFNQLAEALGRARAENASLYGQLITVQEDERREIATELHDEASPCLFGIMANALSIERLSERRRDRKTVEIRGHVKEIVRIGERLKMMNRILLKKLRPVALGRVALSALVEDLMGELGRRYPDVALTHSARTRRATYGEAIDLTIYRSVQEGVTNAIRHGKADAVRVELFEKRQKSDDNGEAAASTLQLLIQDDGRGIPPDTALGFGLTVMRERVNALGGSCAIQSVPAQGTALRVIIPVKAAHSEQRKQIERIEAN